MISLLEGAWELWTPEYHFSFPGRFRREAFQILLCAQRMRHDHVGLPVLPRGAVQSIIRALSALYSTSEEWELQGRACFCQSLVHKDGFEKQLAIEECELDPEFDSWLDELGVYVLPRNDDTIWMTFLQKKRGINVQEDEKWLQEHYRSPVEDEDDNLEEDMDDDLDEDDHNDNSSLSD